MYYFIKKKKEILKGIIPPNFNICCDKCPIYPFLLLRGPTMPFQGRC
jgi:hypothetical protein